MIHGTVHTNKDGYSGEGKLNKKPLVTEILGEKEIFSALM